MAIKLIAFVTLFAWALAGPVSPLVPRDPFPEAQANTPTPAVPEVTVSRTITVPAWSKTDLITQYLNCTRTNYVSASSAPAATVPTSTVTASAPPATILGRQSAPPTPTTSARTITRTTWVVETSTRTGDLNITSYRCTATVDYAVIIDATTTETYTITVFPRDHTVTATTTINCSRPTSRPRPPTPPSSMPPRPPSSMPPRPPSSLPPLPPSSLPPLPPSSLPPLPPSSLPPLQPTPPHSAAAPVVAAVETDSPPATTAALTTVHLTRTIYARTTLSATGYTTAWVRTCSSTATPTTSVAPPLLLE